MDFSTKEYISAYYIKIGLSVFTILFLWKLKKLQKLRDSKGSNRLTPFGHLDILKILYWTFANTGSVDGQKISRLQLLYKKFLSSSAPKYSKTLVWKIFGKIILVCAGDYDTINTIYKNDAFTDRGPEMCMTIYTGDKLGGIALNNGENWAETKRFTMKKLGKIGLRKRETMTLLLAEQLPLLMDLIECRRKDSGNKIQVEGLFSVGVLNILLSVIVGKTFSVDDPVYIELFKGSVLATTDTHILQLLGLAFISKIWGVRELFGYSKLIKLRDHYRSLIMKLIEERESLGIYNENPEVFIDYFLKEIENQKDDDKLKELYCKSQLVTLLQDLLIAGMDTSSKFLESLIMFMCLHPDIQKKVQAEIDSVIGTSAVPLYFQFKSRMPYTFATFNEVHRMANILPIIPKMTTKEVRLGDLHLGKGTIVACLYFPLHFDDTYWTDPFVFHPERFLDDTGNLMQDKVDRMILFGTGGRACPGESISAAVTFTFGVGLLQKYTLRRGFDTEILGLKEHFGIINGPEPFHISIFER